MIFHADHIRDLIIIMMLELIFVTELKSENLNLSQYSNSTLSTPRVYPDV